MTHATGETVELRALMSASDSSTAWELRCEARERLLEDLQRAHPGGLPRVRAALGNEPETTRGDPRPLRDGTGPPPSGDEG